MSSTASPNLRLYLHTPLRDIFRRQLTGRLDWKARLADSNLPGEICDTVNTVVSNTGLSRLEKAQVCDELVAHFQDGSRAGESFEDLLKQFGNPDNVAKLIRRGKIRNRSMFSKIGRFTAYFSLAAIAGYAAITIYFFMGSPNPTTDFMVELNAPVLELSDEDMAWPIHRDTWIKEDFCERPFPVIFVSNDDNQQRSGKLLQTSDASWPEAVAFLRDHRDMLDAFRAAGNKPAFGLELKSDIREYDPLDAQALFPRMTDDDGAFNEDEQSPQPNSFDAYMEGSLVHVLLPHIQSLRTVARFLKIDTRLAIQEDDSDRAVKNILATFGTARHAAEHPILVCGLVGFAVTDLGLDQVEEATAKEGFLSDSQLEEIQLALADLPLRQFIDLQGERAMMYDILQRVYTDDGNGDGRMTAQGVRILQELHMAWGNQGQLISDDPVMNVMEKVLGPASLFTIACRKEMQVKYDEVMDKAELAFDQPISMVSMNFDEMLDLENSSERERVRYLLLDTLLPAIDSVRNAMESRMARRDAAELAVAATRFYMANDRYPQNAEQISPAYLKSVPVDPMTGADMKWIVDKDGILKVYSVGNNNTDDQGSPLTDSKSDEPLMHGEFNFQSFEQQPLDGDWILWPGVDTE